MYAMIISCCICALFGGWVWTLKGEIENLHSEVSATNAGHRMRHESAWPGQPTRNQIAMAEEHAPGVKRTSSGVPTWTIEG
jgi:hypothetical protein